MLDFRPIGTAIRITTVLAVAVVALQPVLPEPLVWIEYETHRAFFSSFYSGIFWSVVTLLAYRLYLRRTAARRGGDGEARS